MKKSAFTLAEVLITLGIIGVVAAMTLPALIQNYKKREVESRLKYTYSLLTEVFKRAEADYGEPKYWEAFSGGTLNANQTISEMRDFINKYMLPYLSGAEYIENKSFSDVGYKDGWKNPDGTAARVSTRRSRFLRLKNGIIMEGQAGVVNNSSNIQKLTQILFYFDTNGTEKPNLLGKDIFAIALIPSTGQIIMAGEINGFYSETGLPAKKPENRQDLINTCIEIPWGCGALIKHDGWEFKKDYPYPW